MACVVRVDPWQIRGSSLAGPWQSGVILGGPGWSGVGPGCLKMFKASGAVRAALQSGVNPASFGCKPCVIRNSSGVVRVSSGAVRDILKQHEPRFSHG